MNNKQALSNFFFFSKNFKKFAKTRNLYISNNNFFVGLNPSYQTTGIFRVSDEVFETRYKEITKFLGAIAIDQEMLLLCFDDTTCINVKLDTKALEVFCGSETDVLNTANKFLRTNGTKSGIFAFNFKKDEEPGYIYKPYHNMILPPPPTLKDLFNAKHEKQDFYSVNFFYQ